MQTSSKWVTLLIAMLLTASTLAVAADAKSAKEPTSGMSRMGNRDMQHGMTPGGMMSEGMMGGGMMGMMNACGGMMNGASIPQLPPGNEKLQMKMQGEMMQKMGEILSKYADQVKEGKAGNP